MNAQSGAAAPVGDRLAILLSGLCIVHCLAMPLVFSLLPWLGWAHEHEPLIHRLLLLVIVPLSITVLLSGFAKHSHYLVLSLGVVALLLLIAAAAVSGIPHPIEIALTALGSTFLIASHLLNMRVLTNQSNKDCIGA